MKVEHINGEIITEKPLGIASNYSSLSLPGRLYTAKLVPYLCAAIILIGRGEGDEAKQLRTPISPVRIAEAVAEIIVKSRVDFSDSTI